jgi:hypothetical protein
MDISLSEDDKVKIILGQTNYDEITANKKLLQFNHDHILVIKDFMGVKEKPKPVRSVNQEIYKQLRMKLDSGMEEFRKKNESC